MAAEAAARQAAAKVVEPHLKYAAQLVALVDMGFAGLVVYSIRQLIVAARLLLDSSCVFEMYPCIDERFVCDWGRRESEFGGADRNWRQRRKRYLASPALLILVWKRPPNF